MLTGTLVAVIVSSNTILFLAALYWTTTSWLRIAYLKRALPWLPHRCLVHESSVTASYGRWRAEFLVSNVSLSAPAERVPAFRYGTPVYNASFAEASQFTAKVGTGQSHACWVAPGGGAPPRVAMDAVDAGPSRADTEVAVISSLLVSVSALALLIVLVSVVRRKVRPRAASLGDAVSEPVEAARTALSSGEIDQVCRARQGVEMETCAICFDEGGLGVGLPCGHPFHEACIRAWLHKGGMTCPLCCYELESGRKGRAASEANDVRLD